MVVSRRVPDSSSALDSTMPEGRHYAREIGVPAETPDGGGLRGQCNQIAPHRRPIPHLSAPQVKTAHHFYREDLWRS